MEFYNRTTRPKGEDAPRDELLQRLKEQHLGLDAKTKGWTTCFGLPEERNTEAIVLKRREHKQQESAGRALMQKSWLEEKRVVICLTAVQEDKSLQQKIDDKVGEDSIDAMSGGCAIVTKRSFNLFFQA